MISVCLCDPQPVVRQGLEAMLADSAELVLRGFCAGLDEVAELVEREQADVLILDRSFGMHPVLETLAEVRSLYPKTAVVLWAATISDVECFRALQAGARGIMKKTIAPATLAECLLSVARDELWTENLYSLRDSALDRPRGRPLTPREQQVAALVSKGMKNREIGEALGIATGTVKIHLMHIFEKTGIRDRFELALEGLRLATERRGREAGRERAQADAEPSEASLA